jgi:hypothetical protein
VKVKLTPFLEKQKDRLLQLRDSLLDSMSGVAKDTLRAGLKAARPVLSECIKLMPGRMRMTVILP